MDTTRVLKSETKWKSYSGQDTTDLSREFFHVTNRFEQLYYEHIDLKEEYDTMKKDYNNCVTQLHARNSGDFYKKVFANWKAEVETLQAKIDELNKKALE